MQFPERPTANPWQLFGQALNQGAGIVDDFQQAKIAEANRQNVLQDLVQRRTDAQMERERQAREDEQRQLLFQQQQDDRAASQASASEKAKMEHDFRKFAMGKQKETAPAKTEPYLSPGMGPNGETSMETPAQFETVPRTRDEMAQGALQYGQITPDKFLDDTKPATGLSLEDRIALATAQAGLRPEPQQTPYIKVERTNPDTGMTETVFVDPRNPGGPVVAPGGLDKVTTGANAPVNGERAIPGLAPIPGVSITKDSVKAVKDAYAKYTDFKNQLDNYKALIKAHGAEAFGQKADELDAYATGMAMTLKELNNLGVLNGPDLTLLQKQIPTASGPMATLKSGIYGAVGQDAITPRLESLSKNMDSKFKTMAKANGFQMEAPPEEPSGPKTALSAQDKQAILWARKNPTDPRSAAILQKNGMAK